MSLGAQGPTVSQDGDRVEFELLGWPEAGPTLRLDYREFAYAGKFVTGDTGKAVFRRTATVVTPEDTPETEFDRDVVAAVSFDADRTDPTCAVVRYVTVRGDRRGDGLGPRLLADLIARIDADGRFERVRIAVNNPYAYVAMYRAGFAYTGTETGIAEVVLERPVETPADRDPERYRAGLERFLERDRELDDEQRAFVEGHRARGPPAAEPGPEGNDPVVGASDSEDGDGPA
jgi:GNAT superfamily N-acetyltransferase